MVITDIGPQICRISIVNLSNKVFLDQWFGIKEGTIITDYLTHITGIDQNLYAQKMLNKKSYGVQHKQIIMDIAKDKIIVGHDLVNDLRLLNIKHEAFIDTVALLPHHFGLPLKNKLKDLTFEYLHKHIHWGIHDPIQDCLCALQIVQKHINNGRGTIQIQKFPQKDYQNNYEVILEDAELDKQKVLLLVLRGSRALGIEIQHAYKSDWDYVIVYDTQSQLDGRLIKLPNIDITFFDRISYHKHMNNNDISYLQMFFLDKTCIYRNKITFPQIQIDKVRASLGFHLHKTKMKIKRFTKQAQTHKYEWKILKALHLQFRFLDFFMQINQFVQQYQNYKRYQNEEMEEQKCQVQVKLMKQTTNEGQINQKNLLKKSQFLFKINIKRANKIWFEIEKQFIQSKNYEEVKRKFQKIIKEKLIQTNMLNHKKKMLIYKGHQIKDKPNKHHQQQKNHQNKIHDSDSSEKINPLHLQLQTIKFLRQNPIQEIEKYKIISKRHRVFENLIQLHYLQSANFKNQIAKQCRGIIVDQSAGFQIVALPYYKFFDYNDPIHSQVNKIDWQSAKVYEKKDGSIAFLYYYAQQWNVASSTVPDGQNSYCFAKKQTTNQFKNQFWTVFYELGFKLPNKEDTSKTFIFELMSKNHIIVVKRQVNQLYLHGVRDIMTLKQENHLPYAAKYNWKVTNQQKINKQQLNLQFLINKVEKLHPLQSEGFIVCDKNWTRVKIKNSSYVRINWLGQLNLGFNKDPKKYILMQIILSGEAQIFCKYCPEWQNIIRSYLQKIKRLNQQVCAIYELLKQMNKKELALNIKKYSKQIQTFVFTINNNPDLYYGKVETILHPKNFYTFLQNYK